MTAGPARVVFLGSGGFAVPTLYRLTHWDEVEVVGVVTAPDRPAGRGGKVREVPVAGAARKHDLALLQPVRIRAPEAIQAIRDLRPELVVLADYGQIVPQAILDIPWRGILNVHPSLLPRHRGASPIPATILAGDAETGVTLIEMDAGLDTGPIVAVERWPMIGDETASELEARAAGVGAGLVAKWVGPWLRGEIAATPQPSEGATLTRPLRREDGRLDPTRPATDLARQVRAYQPWPGSFIDTKNGRLIVLAATVEPGATEAPRALLGGRDLRLATSDGWLVLDEVQPAGRRPMSGESYARGRPELRDSV